MPGTLYLIATPIGNLGDITLRAIDTLRSVDLIGCEDTRHTRKLLNHYKIATPAVSYHEHNENERSVELVKMLLDGKSVAIVSDAGTPGISDPGVGVVRRAIDNGISVVSLPGPVAFVSAVVSSGLATDSIFYGGFLPAKQSDRQKRLAELSMIAATLVLYEAPHRLVRSLADCLAVLGDRHAAVARELTKIHEVIERGTLAKLHSNFSREIVKGEIVIAIDRHSPQLPDLADRPSIGARIRELEATGHDRKSALKLAAKQFGLSRSAAYREFLAEK